MHSAATRLHHPILRFAARSSQTLSKFFLHSRGSFRTAWLRSLDDDRPIGDERRGDNRCATAGHDRPIRPPVDRRRLDAGGVRDDRPGGGSELLRRRSLHGLCGELGVLRGAALRAPSSDHRDSGAVRRDRDARPRQVRARGDGAVPHHDDLRAGGPRRSDRAATQVADRGRSVVDARRRLRPAGRRLRARGQADALRRDPRPRRPRLGLADRPDRRDRLPVSAEDPRQAGRGPARRRVRAGAADARRGAHPHRARAARRVRPQHVRDPYAGDVGALSPPERRPADPRGVHGHRGGGPGRARRDAPAPGRAARRPTPSPRPTRRPA